MDEQDRLRRTLQDHATEVRPHREAPSALGRRAGRRIAFNSLIVGASAVVVVAAVVVGVQALRGPGPAVVGPGPTTVGGHTTAPSPTGASTGASPSGSSSGGSVACTPGQLRANGDMTGAAGSREGVIDVANFSDTACTLQGRPGIVLLTSPGHLVTSPLSFIDSPAAWQADGRPEPSGWPVVTLRPGDMASVRIRWGNWCSPRAPLWRIGIPGGGEVDVVNGMEDPPPCNGAGMPSTIEVGPFEPHRGP
ncbi:MAG TPA: DUF4232 domain-containing protein [Actinomycetota bacterium]